STLTHKPKHINTHAFSSILSLSLSPSPSLLLSLSLSPSLSLSLSLSVPPPSLNMTLLPSTEDHSLTPPQPSTPPTSNTSSSSSETTISEYHCLPLWFWVYLLTSMVLGITAYLYGFGYT